MTHEMTKSAVGRSVRPRTWLVGGLLMGGGLAGACGSEEASPGGAQAGAGGAGAAAGLGGSGQSGAPPVSGAAGANSVGGGAGTSSVAGTGGAAAGAAGSGGAAAGQGGSAGSAVSTGGAGAGGINGGAGSGGVAGASASAGSAGASAGSAGASGAPNAAAPSCATPGPGRTTCGENGDESCCTSPLVAGGEFFRTYENSGSGSTDEADPATVSSFRLDKYEVTVGRFREYVKYLNDGGVPPAAGSGKHAHLNGGSGLTDSVTPGSFEPGWDASWNENIPSGAGSAAEWNDNLACNIYGTWTDEPGDNELLPLTCLNWWESHAFCIWDGGFLPSEAEWRYAAAGGDEQRMYPWGTTNPGTGSEYAIYDCCYPDPAGCRGTSGQECTGIVNAAPVGFATLGAGRYGQLDLVGGVFEWLVDRYGAFASPCTDCGYFGTSGDNRVLPGGGFRTTLMPYLLSSNRSAVSYAVTFRGDFAVGARCARSP